MTPLAKWKEPLWSLGVALWMGSMIGVYLIGASVVFSFVGEGIQDSVTAGTIAGRMFQWQYTLAIVIFLLLTIFGVIFRVKEKTSRKGWIPLILILLAGLFLLTELLWITPKIQDLRIQLMNDFGGVAQAPEDNPMRKQFGTMHFFSVIRALLEFIALVAGFLLHQLWVVEKSPQPTPQ